MKKIRFDYDYESGYTVVCDFEGTIPEYAMMWLNLTNNARCYPNVFVKISNTDSNIIYVTIYESKLDDVIRYLEGLELKILITEECNIVLTQADYEFEDKEFVFADVETY